MSRHSVSGSICPVSRLKSYMKPTNVSRDLRMTTRADSDVQPRCLCVNVLTCRATPPPPEVLIDSNECRAAYSRASCFTTTRPTILMGGAGPLQRCFMSYTCSEHLSHTHHRGTGSVCIKSPLAAGSWSEMSDRSRLVY